MRFTYIYRDASGAKQAGEIEAEDRADCFARLKERGTVPVNVREGAARGGAADVSAAPRGGRWRVAALAAAVLLSALGVWWWLASRPAGEPREPQAAPPRQARPARVEKPQRPRPATNSPAAKPAPETPAEPPKPLDAARTPWTNIYTNRRGEEVRVGRDGKRVAMLAAWQRKREEEAKHPQRRVFRHTAEAYMAMFLNPAEAVPPPPENFTDSQVALMLANKIEIDPENDTPDEIRQKEGVKKLKEELKAWIKDGGTFDGYLGELQKRQNLEAAKMLEARRMISEAMERGNVEEARELYDAINRHFDEQGMPHVNVAPKYRKILNQPKAEQK